MPELETMPPPKPSNSSNDLVSVILPVFNRAGTIDRAIKSVLSQSYANLELIVVDDGSTDAISHLVQAFTDPRLRYIRRERNGGAAAARNTGIEQARGQYIAFQDSDDLWLPDKLEHQHALLSQAPSTIGAILGKKIVYGLDRNFISGRDRVSIMPVVPAPFSGNDDQLGFLLTQNRMSVQCCLFRRTCKADAHWFDECATANEDWELAIQLARTTRFLEMDDPVVLGFTSSDSISRSERKQALGTSRVLKRTKDLQDKYPAQYASIIFMLGRSLTRLGRRRIGRSLVLAAIWRNPDLIRSVALSKLRAYRQVRA